MKKLILSILCILSIFLIGCTDKVIFPTQEYGLSHNLTQIPVMIIECAGNSTPIELRYSNETIKLSFKDLCDSLNPKSKN